MDLTKTIMKKIFLALVLFVFTLTAAAQVGDKPSFKRVRFTPVTATDTTNLTNGTVFYSSVSNKFRFRQNGSTISLGSGSGVGVTDGDKGDITVTGSGVTWTIDNNVVTTAKMSTFSSSDLAGKLTDESGTGVVAYTTSPTFTTPALGTPSALVLTNATGLPGTAVINTPAGNIAATTAQAAINELDGEKLAIANTSSSLTDGSAITITGTKHTLTSDEATVTWTLSQTSDFQTTVITLNTATTTYTFPSNTLCRVNGIATGDNTATLVGNSGDIWVMVIYKDGTDYKVAISNWEQ